ncbi:DUF1758 domain-containing protein [Trichonephila clavipes]|nr:DUF1758 domain-containing protein [Trichonephila clavipes]
MIARLVLLKRKKSLMAKGKCFICFQNHIRKFCNNNDPKCKICGFFSHNSLICENGQRATGGLLVTPAIGVQSPSEERGNSRDKKVYDISGFSAKEKKNNVSGSVLLQTFSAVVNAKPKGSVQLRCMLDGGANKSFILREVVELLDLKVVDKEGKEDEVNCKDIFANHLIVRNEELDFDRVRNLWSLETIGINPDNEVPLSDKEILKSFEQNTVYTNKRYETRLLWKEYSRELKKTVRYTRVTVGVKCSPFLLATAIRLHVEKYINKYKRACEMLDELYVDDLINSTSDTTEALQLSEEMIHILGEAGMNLRRWATNSTTLHEAWKRATIDCRETSQ